MRVTNKELNEKIVLAIQLRKPVVITYKEEKQSRLIHIHALYRNSKENLTIDAWQKAGKTNSELEKFKCFLVEEIQSIAISSNIQFEANEKYNPKSDRYIDCPCKIWIGLDNAE